MWWRTLPAYTNGEPGVLRERLIFRHPGGEVRKSALGEGFELRAGDLMSIVPPSVNPSSGEPYEWRLALDEVPICGLPDSWLAQSQNGAGPAPEIPDTIPYGVQHQTLVGFAGSMRRRGARANEIAAALKEMNKRCERPGTAEAMDEIARSMEKYAPAHVPLGNGNETLVGHASAASPPKEVVVVTRLRELKRRP